MSAVPTKQIPALLTQTAEEKEAAFRSEVIRRLVAIENAMAINLDEMKLRFVEIGVRLDSAAAGAPTKRAAKAPAADKKAPTLMAQPAGGAAAIPAAGAAPAAEKPPANTMYYFAWCYGTGNDESIKQYYTADDEKKALEKVTVSPTYKKATTEYERRRIVGLAVWAAGVSAESKKALKDQFKNYQDTAAKSVAHKQVQPEAESDGDGADD